ncbi:MAG TPA: hypothetical protein VGK79_04985 [Gaiellaceae bacterium]|jgi:hypothetical protein
MKREDILDSIVRLVAIEERAPQQMRAEIALVRERLEDDLGRTVRASEAARLLGVTRPALKRWIDKSEIATVLTPSGRREIPVSEVVTLLREVEAARSEGSERALAAVIRDRWRAADAVDIERLLPRRRGRTHRDVELQSLAYHRLVAERLTPDLLDRARMQLDRWERTGRIHRNWADAWHLELDKSIDDVRKLLRSDSGRARELRQTSPFVGLLTEQERRRLLEAVEMRR